MNEPFRAKKKFMNIKKRLKNIRMQQKLSLKEAYGDIFSKGKYLKFEENETDITVEELNFLLTTKYGLSWDEFIFFSGLADDSLAYYRVKKKKLGAFSQEFSEKEFIDFKETAYFERKLNLQHYSVYIGIGALICFKKLDIPFNLDESLKEIKLMYKKRTTFFAVDYEILANLVVLTKIQNLEFLTKRLFPIPLDRGDRFLGIVLVTLNNILDKTIERKDYDLAELWINEFESILEKIPNLIEKRISIHILIFKSLLLLKKTNDIHHYAKILEYAQIFKLTGDVNSLSIVEETINRLSNEHKDLNIPKDFSVYVENQVPKINIYTTDKEKQ